MTDDICGCTKRDGSGDECQLPAGWGTGSPGGPCKYHGGSGGSGDDHEGNDWAAKHGAYSESFVKDFLTEREQAMLDDLQDVLGTPEGAQENARMVAAIAQLQFRRTGDERFLRRYESICDTFGIAPADELELSGDGGGPLEFTLTREVVDSGDE